MKLTNFTGILPEVHYRILVKRPSETNFALVELYIKIPGTKEYIFFDLTAGMAHDSYKDNLRRALLMGEDKWGLELLKLDISEFA